MNYPQLSGKKLLTGLVACVCLAAIAYSGYTLFQKQRDGYRQEGYASALSQLVEASKDTREVNVTVGDQTVKFVVITPTQTPVQEPSSFPQ